VLQPEDTRTPLRQLYFIVQTVLIDPANSADARSMFHNSLSSLLETFKNEQIRTGLLDARECFDRGRTFDALKTLRSLFAVEDGLLGKSKRSDDGDSQQRCEVG
jgi:flagellar protein FlbT